MNHRPLFRRQLRGFTLIELLVVISIIALLATMGVAGGQIVMRKAREVQAKAAIKGLEIAIKGYQTEYLRLPSLEGATPTEDNADGYDTSAEDGKALLSILLAQDITKNPRQVQFYEPPTAKTGGAGYTPENGLRDSFGQNGYKVIMDYSGDGQIVNPYAGTTYGEPENIHSAVIIYSAGSNKLFETGGPVGGSRADDVKSWQ